METGAGPFAELVLASIITVEALEKFPRAETSTTTVRGSPAPLLSPAA